MTSLRDEDEAVVILVHGLYMHGIAMIPLERRLVGCGLRCRRFSYPSLRRSVAENARRLSEWLRPIDAPAVHFVCHSLGGTVVRAMLVESSWRRPGRVLTLGTPHRGCRVASRLGARPASGWLVGASLEGGLDGHLPPWPEGREVATIAGVRPIGLGRLAGGLPKPNDGVVTLDETDLGAAYPRVVLPVNHSGMLISRTVAEHACAYLKTGRFPDAKAST